MCHLHKHSFGQPLFRSKGSSDIYFVFDIPEDDDLRFNQVCVGKRGRYLENCLQSLEIDNYRVWTLVRCIPYDYDYSLDDDSYLHDVPIRQPTSDEIKTCRQYLDMDIIKSQPKVIVTLGGVASQSILGTTGKISQIRGRVYDTEIRGQSFKVIPTYSPSYLLKGSSSIGEAVGDFFLDLRKAKSIVDGTWVDPMEVNELSYAKTYQEFKEFYVKNLANEDMLAYDIETNAELVYSKGFRIIGFSLAKRHCGVYVCKSSLDYEMPEEDQKLCDQLLIAILKKVNKVIVHNSLYERPATLYNLGYEMSFDKVEDTLVMAKLMLGGKTGAGLKPNAKKIGYPDWDADIDEYIYMFKTLLSRLKLVKYKFFIEDCRDGSKSLLSIVEGFSDEDREKYSEIVEYVETVKTIFEKYYPEMGDLHQIFNDFTKALIDGFDNGIPGTIPYNWIPSRVLCAYGATDSLATFDLYDHYLKRFENESTEKVNLRKGYYYALMEHYTGYELMMSGLKWDDTAAQRDYENFQNLCLTTLKYLDQDPKVEEYIVRRVGDSYIPDLIYEYYNDYLWETFERRVIDVGEGSYKMEYYDRDRDKVKKKHIKHLLEDIELPESVMSDIQSKVVDIVRDRIKNATSVSDLKSMFNPASTVAEVTSLAKNVLLTEDLRVCHFIRQIKDNIIGQEDFSPSNYSENEQGIIYDVSQYLKIPPEKWRDRIPEYERLKKRILGLRRFETEHMQYILGDMYNFEIEGLDDGSQIAVFDDLCVGPMNPDDPDSWGDTFKWLVNLRGYKKSSKIISSYIEGKVGRESVYAVDEEPLLTGSDVFYRHENYYDLPSTNKGQAILPEGRSWLEQTNFGVGTADTGRWRSAYHVLPAGSSVKKMYISRFKGGTILQPDFSANELRCIASAANETNMLQAFADGLDIHKSNAAMVFRVPIEEVTPFQRRWAKTLSFGVLYGMGPGKMAENYFHGDLEKAKEMLNNFYSAFPNLRTWIDEKHQEVLETHKVSVLTDRFLNIDFDPNDRADVATAFRKSGNYPIQSASSTMAAVIFCDIIRYCKENGLRSKGICFIHDSLESDLYPYELFQVIEYQQHKLATGAIDYFGIACKADVSLGYSMGHECEMKSLDILNDEKTEGRIVLEGYQDEVYDTINNWKQAYNLVEIVDEEWEELFVPMSQMFIARKAYDPTVLSTRKQGTVTVHVRYYDENGNISPMVNDFEAIDIWKESELIGFLG